MSVEVSQPVPAPTSIGCNANKDALQNASLAPESGSGHSRRRSSISSRFGDLVKFLSSVQGDLANITAPPAFLAPNSVTEAGHCWAQQPALFAAPTLEEDPVKRSLLVLRMVLVAMRSQFYIGGAPGVSIKKPLNAFLGELFIASWTDDEGRTTQNGVNVGPPATAKLIAEQVCHHPPITAMHIVDQEHGIRADGYARVQMTFSSSVDIKQIGHALLHIDRFDEDYLIPLPDVHVRGFLSGKLYPEVLGTYTIVSSTGYVSEMKFSGSGVFSGKRNSFEAKMYRKDDPKKKAIYEVNGVWSDGWTVKNAAGDVIEKYVVDAEQNRHAPINILPISEQDPWESRRAWSGVIDGIRAGDYRHTVHEKSQLEQAQRNMRSDEAKDGKTWDPLFFKSERGEDHADFHRLAKGTPWQLQEEKTNGVWRIDPTKVNGLQRPFRGNLTPLGQSGAS